MAEGQGLRGACRWYLIGALVLLCDQISKWAASAALDYARPQRLFSWFDLTLHHNSGAAFSFLSGAGGWQRWFFTTLAVVVSAVIVQWLRRLPPGRWILSLALALILGGALGNLVDRLLHGYVVDFISLHYGGWYFPTFNIADSAISVGAVLVIIDSMLVKEEDDAPGGAPGPSAPQGQVEGDRQP